MTSTTDLPIKIKIEEDTDEITIEWDEKHPLAAQLDLDNWTEDQWKKAIESGLSDIAQVNE